MGVNKSKKRKKEYRILGTGKLSQAGHEVVGRRSIIQRLRLNILVHSYLYYHKDESLIPDHAFDMWCKQLKQLQRLYPDIAERVDYHGFFVGDFKCYDLPVLPEIVRKAEQVLEWNKKDRKGYFKIPWHTM